MGFSRQEHWSGLPFPSPKGTIERKKVKSLSCVWLFATPWTAAHQAPPSMEFFRQEYCGGLPFPSPSNAVQCQLVMKADRDRVEKVVLRTSKIMDYKGPSDHLHELLYTYFKFFSHIFTYQISYHIIHGYTFFWGTDLRILHLSASIWTDYCIQLVSVKLMKVINCKNDCQD